VSIILNKNEYLHKLGKMVAKSLVLGIAMAMLALSVVGSILQTSSVWAATIQCNSTNNPCFGTDADDTMIGDDGDSFIGGKLGNDVISGKAGDDVLVPAAGNDMVSGDSGDDTIAGDSGTDRMSGGEGADKIYHNVIANPSDFTSALLPDGSKDKIDCGSGNDEVWINISVDHDIVANCEIVHAG